MAVCPSPDKHNTIQRRVAYERNAMPLPRSPRDRETTREKGKGKRGRNEAKRKRTAACANDRSLLSTPGPSMKNEECQPVTVSNKQPSKQARMHEAIVASA